jgi:hypothetical protein
VKKQKVRAADAKEVGVENPAEETFRYPNLIRTYAGRQGCQRREIRSNWPSVWRACGAAQPKAKRRVTRDRRKPTGMADLSECRS